MILYPDGRIEGTPEELAQWKRMQAENVNTVKINIEKLETGTSIPWKTQIISSGVTNGKTVKCPNEGYPCFCTGACM